MQREILGERPKHKFSQFLKTSLNKNGLKTLLIDLDETLVHSTLSFDDTSTYPGVNNPIKPDFILSVKI
jgi:predicted HAD superfamily phosphohydrolase YqeG